MSENVIVKVGQGALRGCKVSSVTGGYFYSFQGVPYAKPPLGRFRFKAPQPPEAWTGIRDAHKEGNVCPQIDPRTTTYVGDEDCLFLNIYSPQIPGVTPSEVELKKAVMVYIHGGGFENGSGNSDIYGPDYLVAEDVVVVTINYRLGPLGFLTTGDREIPGNAGLKDQVAALKWVKLNIGRFGGDPYNVTIFGESAGAASVHYLMLSPLAKGLFQRAICQSGCALNSWAFSTAGRSRTVRLAQALGCTSEDSKEVLEFLKTVPAQQLVENIKLSVSPEEKRRGVYYPFVPTSEAGIRSVEDNFLLHNPIDIIQAGKFNRVPFIIGVNTHEGIISLRDVWGKPEVMKMLDSDMQGLLPEDLGLQLDTVKSQEMAQEVKSFYFGDKPFNQETLDKYVDFSSDSLFMYKINETVREQSIYTNIAFPLYYYEFAFDGQLGMFKKLLGMEKYPGVSHADEIGYLFNIEYFKNELGPDSPEMKVLSTMVKMWTNFAKRGKPGCEVNWEPVSLAKMNCLRIDVKPTMFEDPTKDRIRFWDELYRKSKIDD